ncbi:signal peptidase complex subunit 1 [Pancytospora philotis]|nr:signal peptidase complex subunit 1 [Pancytospora philotis]
MFSLIRKINEPIDYVGQDLSLKLMYIIFAVGYTIAFAVGVSLKRLELTLIIGVATVLVAFMATVPSWPMFKRHPLRFKKAKKAKAE